VNHQKAKKPGEPIGCFFKGQKAEHGIYISIIPALRRLRQKDLKFKAFQDPVSK
jgi:hypothetical protein